MRVGTRRASTASQEQETLPFEDIETDLTHYLAQQKQWKGHPEEGRASSWSLKHIQPTYGRTCRGQYDPKLANGSTCYQIIPYQSPVASSRVSSEVPDFTHHNGLHPVVTTSQNFDDLGFPPDHPGRSRTDTYYVNKERVLRTHTSAHQKGIVW